MGMSNERKTIREEAAKTSAARLAKLPTATLIESWNLTDSLINDATLPEDDRVAVALTREWLMNELERRNADAFAAWLDSNQDSPAQFYA